MYIERRIETVHVCCSNLVKRLPNTTRISIVRGMILGSRFRLVLELEKRLQQRYPSIRYGIFDQRAQDCSTQSLYSIILPSSFSYSFTRPNIASLYPSISQKNKINNLFSCAFKFNKLINRIKKNRSP